MRTQDRRRRGVEIFGKPDRKTQDRPRALEVPTVTDAPGMVKVGLAS